MVHIPMVAPGRVGFQADRLERAYDRLRDWSESGEVAGSVLCVGRRGGVIEPRGFGVEAGTRFLVASITKPIVAAAVLLLVERGELGLDDRVTDTIPEFAQAGKDETRIRHLLTHTSGLPDMLPENEALRAEHAPPWRFVEGACRVEPLFPAGTRVRYQSMGFAVLGGIVERLTSMSLGEFLRREFFEPLGMADSYLGCPPEVHPRVAPIQISAEQAATDWHWNSPYWHGFGAAWGGLVTTAADLARYARMFLDEGTAGRTRVLATSTVRAMTSNQVETLPALDEADRRSRPWGFGWRLEGAGHTPSHGDLLGPETYGHTGATGTLCWIDPATDAFCILLTTRPQGDEGRHLSRISTIVASALA